MKKDEKTNAVDVDVPTEKTDIDAAYDNALEVLNTKPAPPAPKKDAEQDQKDYYQSFRTRCVLFTSLTENGPNYLFSG